MVRSMNVDHRLFMLRKCKDMHLKYKKHLFQYKTRGSQGEFQIFKFFCMNNKLYTKRFDVWKSYLQPSRQD